MAEHSFGGPWTEIKLDAVSYYLSCYTKALSNLPFKLWYIDAFAGSGSREISVTRGGIFDGQPISISREVLAGSARRALAIEPPFDHFLFIEKDDQRRAALNEVKSENSSRLIEVIKDDANVVLRKLASSARWADNGGASSNRGVVFLDPYALQVEWSTLAALSRTKKIDVWYLFPLRDVTRQLAIKHSGIGPKAPMLDRVLGEEWKSLYSLPSASDPIQLSMLEQHQELPFRNVNQKGIELWIQSRLAETFAYASPPLPILTETGKQIFSLFLAVANPSVKAIDLAKHFQRYSFKQSGKEAISSKICPLNTRPVFFLFTRHPTV